MVDLDDGGAQDRPAGVSWTPQPPGRSVAVSKSTGRKAAIARCASATVYSGSAGW